MKILKALSGVMNNTTAYRWWQAPFAKEKLQPVLQNNKILPSMRILDVGCGPGTNCDTFQACDYTGFDINPQYIEYARQRYGRKFVVQDVCTYEQSPDDHFDMILMNSLLHHLDDHETQKLLTKLAHLCQKRGEVHIIDLVLPANLGIPRWLALNDRGDFPRSMEQWKTLFEKHFQTIRFEPFSLRRFGIPLWDLVYFQGKAHTS
jgi:SAM-dependent methyltransferase